MNSHPFCNRVFSLKKNIMDTPEMNRLRQLRDLSWRILADRLSCTKPAFMNRRTFLKETSAAAAVLAFNASSAAENDDLKPIRAAIEKRHDENVKRLQRWIPQPSIAAENRGVSEGCNLMVDLLREAGFQKGARVPTDGQPGVFAS